MSTLTILRPREASGDLSEIGFEAADHHLVTELRLNGGAAHEPLWVEDLKQCGKTVRETVVGRRGEKEAVLETLSQIPHRPGELRIDGVLRAASRSSVVRLVEDQKRTRFGAVAWLAVLVDAEQVSQWRRVLLVAEQRVREDEARVRGPGVHRVAAFAPQRAT